MYMMFLAKCKRGIEVPYIFTKYLYGPYSRELQENLDKLVISNFVRERKVKYGDFIEFSYSLTKKGLNTLDLVSLTKKEEHTIKKFVDEYRGKFTSEIVREAYGIAGLV